MALCAKQLRLTCALLFCRGGEIRITEKCGTLKPQKKINLIRATLCVPRANIINVSVFRRSNFYLSRITTQQALYTIRIRI